MMPKLVVHLIWLAATVLAACAPAAAPTPETTPAAANTPAVGAPIRIGFGGLSFERSAYQPVIDAFNAEHPDLQVEFVPIEPNMSKSPEEQAQSVAAAADTFASLLVGPDATASSVGLDLRPLIDADTTFKRDDYQPGALRSNGVVRVLPTDLSIQTLSYNADLWAAAGLPEPAPSWRWDDLLAAAEQLTKTKGDEITTYGLDDGNGGMLVLQGLLAEAGISLTVSSAGTLQIDTPQVAAIINRVADLIKRGVIYVPPKENTSAVGVAEFGKHIRDGRVALWLGGLLIEAIGGDTNTTAFKIGDAVLPNTPRDLIFSQRGYMISAGTANPDAAWRWLSYLSQQQISFGGGLVLVGIGTDIPARRSLAEKQESWRKLPASRVAAIQATLARVEQLPTAGDLAVRMRLDTTLAAIRSGTDVESALAEAQTALNTDLANRAKTPTTTTPPVAVQLPDQPVIPDGATKISFGSFGDDMAALRQLADQYNALHPESFVTIDPPAFDGNQFSLAAIAKQHPCFSWPQEPQDADLAALRDIQPTVDADATFDLSDYPVALLSRLKINGKLYGLPYSVQLRALNYNRELFREADLSAPTKDWSWEELLTAAERITRKEGAAPVFGYAAEGSQADDLLAFLRWQNAVAVESGVPRFTSEPVETALSRYVALLRNYSPHTQLQGYSTNAAFIGTGVGQEGRIGFWFSSGLSGIFITFGDSDPNRTPADLAVAPPPTSTTGLTHADFSADILGIAAGATDAEADACWGWLKFLSEQRVGLGDRFPARSSIATSQAFQDQALPGAADVYAAYRDALANPASASDPYRGIDLFWLMRAVDRALQGNNLQRELADAQRLTEQYLACIANGGKADECAKTVDPSYQGIGPRS